MSGNGPSDQEFSMHVNSMNKEFVDLVLEFQESIPTRVPQGFATPWHEQMYVSDVAATAACALLAFALSCIDNDEWDEALKSRMEGVKKQIKWHQDKAREAGIKADIKAPGNTTN